MKRFTWVLFLPTIYKTQMSKLKMDSRRENKIQRKRYSESLRLSTGKFVKGISENQERHFKSGVTVSFPVFCGGKESPGRAIPTLLITLIAPVSSGLKAGNTALKANSNHRRSWLGGCEGTVGFSPRL